MIFFSTDFFYNASNYCEKNPFSVSFAWTLFISNLKWFYNRKWEEKIDKYLDWMDEIFSVEKINDDEKSEFEMFDIFAIWICNTIRNNIQSTNQNLQTRCEKENK